MQKFWKKQGEGDKGSMKIATFAALLNGEVEENDESLIKK